jgi:Ubiquitin family
MVELTLYVKTLDGKTNTVVVSPEMTVLEGKKLILDTAPDMQRWIWAGDQLVDNETFGDIGIKNEDVVHLVLKMRGGGGVNFSRMDKKMQIDINKVTDETPKYLIVATGLNIRCVCDWDKCPTQNHGGNVYFQMGLGKHDLTNVDSRCPECTQPVRMVTPCFINCSYRIDGVLVEDEKRIYFEGIVLPGKADEYDDNKTAEWKSLIIRCFGAAVPHVAE